MTLQDAMTVARSTRQQIHAMGYANSDDAIERAASLLANEVQAYHASGGGCGSDRLFGHAPTPKPATDPRVPAFLRWYAAESASISHVPYVIEWSRDSAIVKSMLKARGGNERILRELAWTFLHLADDWHDKIGRTIPSLKRQANVLAERRSKALYAAGVSDFTDAMLGLAAPEPTV